MHTGSCSVEAFGISCDNCHKASAHMLWRQQKIPPNANNGNILQSSSLTSKHTLHDILGHGDSRTGHEIAPNTGTNVTKFFTLATKS